MRSAGVLLPFFSLPGPFESGVFGIEAVSFAKNLVKAGISEWLVLPFTAPGAYYSPYAALSSFAGSSGLIDPRYLVKKGLLNQSEIAECKKETTSFRINYPEFFARQKSMLKLAFSRLSAEDFISLNQFKERETYWLYDYAAFMCIRDFYGGLPWWEWPNSGLVQRDPHVVHEFVLSHQAEFDYYCYEQLEFHRQWQENKAEINDLGIRIIGDLPIYPAADSADIWGKRHFFETDKDGMMARVAGVPPDYFTETGQLWGNPLYDWDVLKQENYHYWVERMGKALTIYDKVRIDHFRGFESYWAVPKGEETAVNGEWVPGPGMDLFNELYKHYDKENIIAEDLGYTTPEVIKFLEDSGLPGMKIFQFAFSVHDPQTTNRPHSYPVNSVAFPGTHDNETLVSWAKLQTKEDWELICAYLDIPPDVEGPDADKLLCRKVILTLMKSPANLVILPVQDLIAADGKYRINLPGSVGDHNWSIRFTKEELDEIDVDWLNGIATASQRAPLEPYGPYEPNPSSDEETKVDPYPAK